MIVALRADDVVALTTLEDHRSDVRRLRWRFSEFSI